MKSSLLLLVLLCLPFTNANDCNVFSSQFENQDAARVRRCSKIYKAVENALWSEDVNKYTLDEAFRAHPPKAIIIHYMVQFIDNNNNEKNEVQFTDRNISNSTTPVPGLHWTNMLDSGTGKTLESPKPDKNDNIACEGRENCTFIIGWSSASIYTFIRPDIFLSLQPAWMLCSLKFSIHEHFGFSRQVTLYINLHVRHDLPENITTHELEHALEQATAKVTIII